MGSAPHGVKRAEVRIELADPRLRRPPRRWHGREYYGRSARAVKQPPRTVMGAYAWPVSQLPLLASGVGSITADESQQRTAALQPVMATAVHVHRSMPAHGIRSRRLRWRAGRRVRGRARLASAMIRRIVRGESASSA
jgi:hypothetical protein